MIRLRITLAVVLTVGLTSALRASAQAPAQRVAAPPFDAPQASPAGGVWNAAAVQQAMPVASDRRPPAGPIGGNAAEWTAPVDASIRLAQSTEEVNRSVALPAAAAAGPPQRGLLQGGSLSADWVPRFEADGLGRSSLSASVSLGVPPFVFGAPVLVTPRAGLHLVDGPDGIDVPARLNDFEIGFGTLKRLGQRWTLRGGITLGVYGDDHSLDDADAFRLSGLGLAIYDAAPTWQWAFGVVYLNRDDISVLPAVGLVRDLGDVRWELIMPRPRVIRRLAPSVNGDERSLYLGGELGGGAWAVARDDGTTDTLNLQRLSLLVGYEVSAPRPAGGPPTSGPGWRAEFGYVFGREIEYADSGETFSVDDSIVARFVQTF